MTKSEWLEYWLSRAPMLSEDDLDDIAYIFTAAGDDEDWPDEAPGAATMPRH